MGKYQSFQQFLTTQSVQVELWGFLLNLVLAAVLAFVLGRLYVKYGHSLSNRRLFARNFVLLTLTTTLIIAIVKSSLALSLGLVGALSIVRFRSAIKEPEELAYLFLCIAIGLGFGADQRLITLAAFAVICGIIALKNYSARNEDGRNLHLTVTSGNPHKAELPDIVATLKRHCSVVELKRFDESKDIVEASFLVEFDDFEHLNAVKSDLQNLNDSIKITFLDNKGIF